MQIPGEMVRSYVTVLFIISFIISQSLATNAFAASTSSFFVRQEVSDAEGDFVERDGLLLNETARRNCAEVEDRPSTDIRSISYNSDGRILNVTVWLPNLLVDPSRKQAY